MALTSQPVFSAHLLNHVNMSRVYTVETLRPHQPFFRANTPPKRFTLGCVGCKFTTVLATSYAKLCWTVFQCTFQIKVMLYNDNLLQCIPSVRLFPYKDNRIWYYLNNYVQGFPFLMYNFTTNTVIFVQFSFFHLL